MIKKIKFDHTNKWYMRNPEPVLENETHKILWDFEIQTVNLISSRRSELVIVNKKKKKNATDNRLKLKENEKRDKYLDLARELKKLWNMKVTVIPIVKLGLGTITKRLVKKLEEFEIRGRVETFQTMTLLRSIRSRWSVLETWGDLLSLKLQWETIQ